MAQPLLSVCRLKKYLMIKGRWIKFKSEQLKTVPNVFGVYAIADENKITLYIGEGKLKARLQAHKRKDTFANAVFYKFEKTGSKLRCQQRERALHREFKKKNIFLPELNVHLGNTD